MVYYGAKTPESLPSQPLSLNKWKRRTAEVLKATSIKEFKRKKESKLF